MEEFRELFLGQNYPASNLAVELQTAEASVQIGSVMLKVSDGWGQREVSAQVKGVEVELGWSFDPDYGGQGYATEAVRAAIALCFGQLGVRRITANCFAANEPSWKLMERLGMRRESYFLQDSLHRSGQWMDSMSYALLASEW